MGCELQRSMLTSRRAEPSIILVRDVTEITSQRERELLYSIRGSESVIVIARCKYEIVLC